MKRIYFSLLLLLQFSYPVFAQDEPVRQLSHNYFKPDPFATEFGTFMQRLVSDPSIQNKDISKKTDTSLFYFFGTYNNYNPFFFKPKRVEVLLEETVMDYSDSTQAYDTILVYQIMAFVNNDEKGRHEIKKEFDKIHRQYSKKFIDRNTKDIVENDVTVGSVHNYFLLWYGLSPVSVAWKELPAANEIVLSLLIRIKPINNFTGLPAPFYKPE